MSTEEIEVANIKCGGCINTVENALKTIPGIIDVAVMSNMKTVKITYDKIVHEDITKKLLEIGYPETK